MNQEPLSKDQENSKSVVHVGDYLRQERESLKISIEKVSQKTKINLNILKSLEANDFKSLPSPAYVKGFVLSYAKVIGLTHDDVVTKLEYSYLTIVGKPFPALNHFKGTETIQATADLKDPAKVLDDEKKIEERKKLVLPISAGIVVIVGIVGLYNLLTGTVKKEMKSQPKAQVTQVIDAESEIESETDSEITIEVHVEAESVATEEVTPIAPETPKEEPKPEVKAVEQITPTKIEATKPVADLSKRVFPPKDFRKINLKLFAFQEADDDTMALLNDEAREKYNSSLENVFIYAFEGNTWLSHKVDDKPIESIKLEKGKSVFLQGGKVLLFFGNVKATRIFYQNKLIDAPTPTGFKSLIFPEKETKNHVLPLFPKATNNVLYTAEEYMKRMKAEEEKLN